MNLSSKVDYVPGDPLLIQSIVSQLKSQGVFDQFRKECISDVDTKPAYQNLCHRVDGEVECCLSDVRWGPDLNKNQLRENIRKYINRCTFVDSGIIRIVDQLVNPRINTVLVPKVADIVCSYLGIEKIDFKINNTDTQSSDKLNWSDGTSKKANTNWNDGRSSSISSNASTKTDKLNWSDGTSKKANTNWNDGRSSSISSNASTKTEAIDKTVGKFQRGMSTEITPDEFSNDSGYIRQADSKTESNTNKETGFGKKSKPNLIESIKIDALEGCSDVDSDEDDISPPYEPHQKSDVEMSAESDYSMDVPEQRNAIEAEEVAVDRVEGETGKVCYNLERICGEETIDSMDGSCSQHVDVEQNNRNLDIPVTPTINYEMSENSKDNTAIKNDASRRESSDPEQNQVILSDNIGDDSLTQKIAKDSLEEAPQSEPLSREKIPNQASKEKSKEEDLTTSKEKERENKDLNKHKRNESRSSDSKYRDRKHSEHKKDKDRSKSDRYENLKSDKDRRSSKEKDKSTHDSSKSRTSKENTDNRDRKDTNKGKEASSDRKILKSQDDAAKHKESGKSSHPSSDKHKADAKNKSNRRSDDPRDERKKKSSSLKAETDKERDKSKYRKEENADVKKSKSQCSTEDKKVRNERRSSDRDSNGPSSSSHRSSHRSLSKSEKDKLSDEYRHSSSSSSHKNKKNVVCNDINSDVCSDDITHRSSNVECTREKTSAYSSRKNKEPVDTKQKVTNSVEKCKSSDTKQAASKKEVMICKKYCNSESLSDESSGVKKPKIARNASDIQRIMELRKQYSEKMNSTEYGKENAKSDYGKETSTGEYEKKLILSNRSSVNMLKESVDNYYVGNKFNKKSTSIDGEEGLTNLSDDGFVDVKLHIRRIDADYRLLDGSCVISDSDLGNEIRSINEEFVSNSNDNIVKNNFMENERTRGLMQEHLWENTRKEDAVKINGAFENSTKLNSCSQNDYGGRTQHESQFNITSEGKNWKARLLQDIEDVRYFEAPVLNTEFRNFVNKRIQESQQIYLENFSIFVKYAERYDDVFRNKLVATVKRKGRPSLLPSPIKYNSEIISSNVGNDRSIMLRIKKTSNLEAGSQCEASNDCLNQSNTLQCEEGHTPSDVDAILHSGADLSFCHPDIAEGKLSGSVKKKTLGIKRKLVSVPKENSKKKTIEPVAKSGNNIPNTNVENNFIAVLESDDDNENVEDPFKSSESNDEHIGFLTPNNEKCNSTISSVLPASQPTPLKSQRRVSIPKLINGIDSKRKQFYYDQGDLYKPRRSFFTSSRRSRNLNSDAT